MQAPFGGGATRHRLRLTPVTGPFHERRIVAGRLVGMSTTGHELPEVVRIARDLIRFDTSNWGGGRAEGEREAAEYVGAYLGVAGTRSPSTTSRSRAARTSWRGCAGRNPDKPALVLHGHLDVVPAMARGLVGRSVRGRDPRRDAVGTRRGRHEGHGRHDPHVGRRHPACRRAARARPHPGRSSRTRRTAESKARSSSSRTIPSGSRARPRRSARSAGTRSPSADRRAYLLQVGEKASDLDPAPCARPGAAHGSRVHPDNAVTRLAEAVAALGRTEWPIAA